MHWMQTNLIESLFALLLKRYGTLEVTHEGTNQVKESKINILVHKYDLFKMEPTESITNMFTRFINIVNSLKSLGKDYTNFDLV